MGEALFELEQVLRSKQETLTPQEANVLLTCKSRALREFTASTLVGAGVVWAATSRLNKFFRVSLSGGAGAVFGLWRFRRSLDSCVDDILALDGSRMQRELANIIVKKYQGDPWRMQLISRHFYSERIFDDSSSDQLMLRWRYRNFFSDNVAHGQGSYEKDSHSVSHNDSPSASHSNSHSSSHIVSGKESHNASDSKKTDLDSKKVLMNSGADLMDDPLDNLFGYMATPEEIHYPGISTTPTRVHTRSHRRCHRRHRMRHREVSQGLQHT